MSSEAPAGADFVERLKQVHRHYPTGVTIVTTHNHGRPYGLAVNAFSSLSLEPPLVLVCVASSSSTYPRLFDGEVIGINILAHDQVEVAANFARSGGDKFVDLGWSQGENGAPLLDGVCAWLELRIRTRVPAGTHTIFIGDVLAAQAYGSPPLLYLGGGFYDGSRLVAVDREKKKEDQ
ncbi:MAG: flavin reductase family protein [Solirubrobacterales bacterium]